MSGAPGNLFMVRLLLAAEDGGWDEESHSKTFRAKRVLVTNLGIPQSAACRPQFAARQVEHVGCLHIGKGMDIESNSGRLMNLVDLECSAAVSLPIDCYAALAAVDRPGF